jgi:hypothetical protein
MAIHDIGQHLVSLCKQAKFLDAIDKHYHKNVVSVEAAEGGGMPRTTTGFDKVRGKSVWWLDNNTVHSINAEGPFAHGDNKFGIIFDMDVTPKAGPMAGQRMKMRELGVYTVQDGKVAHEEFYYNM